MEKLTKYKFEIEELLNILIKKEKNYFLNYNNQNLYKQLIKDKKNGKVMNKEDLTYENLYELSVIENTPDSLIGDIFNITKGQVRYLRKKFGISNIHETKLKSHPEALIYYMEEKNQRPENTSNYECEKIINQPVQNFLENKKVKFLKEDNINDGNEVTINIGDEEIKYHVIFSDEKYSVNSKKSSRNYKGAHRNQKKESETKRINGKIGEKIALEAEKLRLTKLGLEKFVNYVKLVAQIDEDITLDGLGYDLISFNEFGESICI